MQEPRKCLSHGHLLLLLSLLLLLLTPFLRKVDGVRPQLANSSVSFGNANILGSSWDIARVELQFDQDLYVSDMLLCPFIEEPCPSLPSCQPCDWTNAKDLSSTCASASCCGTKTNLAEWCVPSVPFTKLELNTKSEFHQLEKGEFEYFRFFLPPETFCNTIRVRTTLYWGQADVFLSDSSPYPTPDTSPWFRTSRYARGHLSLTMCVFDTVTKLGTFVLAVKGRSAVGFDVTVIVGELKVPISPPPTAGSGCLNIPSNLFPQDYDQVPAATPLVCLEDTRTIVSRDQPSGTEFQVVFSVPPGCVTSSIMFYGLNFKDTTVDVDLYCLPLNSSNALIYSNTGLGSWQLREDWLTFTTCSTERLWIRCGGEVTQGGDFATIFSTRGDIIRTPLVDINPYDYSVFSAKNSFVLATPGSYDLLANPCIDWFV